MRFDITRFLDGGTETLPLRIVLLTSPVPSSKGRPREAKDG